MSKYAPLWAWIKENESADFVLCFDKIENILGFPIDHSFLSYKKELVKFGFKACRISMKERTVSFEKI